ncbi:glycosyltransferase family 4 protein [Kineococcus indalonis]|uniref:glycosyltransferase family 4 protein n=1 Tax=Kineococcus indalonis TaxID=2696566 RepID=UPI001412A5E9|nr:glycosyltransferase family 4 protein [Kineococcus indalonis]NAZ85051.1 glycosyltransferase [Kineococcus indalonis]
MSEFPAVLVVCGYYPPHVGGVEVVAERFATHLAEAGHDVEVVTSDLGSRAHGAPPSAAGPRVPRVRRLRAVEAAHTPLAPLLLPTLLRRAGGRVVHLHLGHVTTDVCGVLAALARRSPLVVHFHMDTPASGPLGAVFELYKRVVLPRLLARADRVVTLSEEQRDLVVRRHGVPAGRVDVLHNGVDESMLAQQPQQPQQPEHATGPGAPLRVLTVGRLAAQKNLSALLRCLPHVQHPVQVHVVGDGELRGELEALRDELDLRQVEFRGVQRGAALRAEYGWADVFAIPSSREGMPLALLEAMANGLAVLASDVQGLREFVRGRGELVAEATPAALAAALDSLAADPQRRRELGAAARAYAAGLTWRSQAAALGDVLRAACRTRAPRGAAGPRTAEQLGSAA